MDQRQPLDAAEPPRGVQHDPHPPTGEEAAEILTGAFAVELGWGVLVWLAMTTGARRGELCALRFDDFDPERAVLSIRSSIAQHSSRSWEKDTKTHQQRRIALDATSAALLRTYRMQCEQTAGSAGVTLAAASRIFSPDPTTTRGWCPPRSPSATHGCARGSAGT